MRVEEYILGPGGIGKPEHLKKFLGFSLKLLKISFYHTHTHTHTHKRKPQYDSGNSNRGSVTI